jgi:hypothetical protein
MAATRKTATKRSKTDLTEFLKINIKNPAKSE